MTMKTPEMEVVRFNESDVIVASSVPVVEHTNVRIANLGTGIVGDATWTYSGSAQGSTDVVDFATYDTERKHNTLRRDVVYSNDTHSTTLGDMIDGGDAANLFTDFNGFYETLDGGNSWHKIQ